MAEWILILTFLGDGGIATEQLRMADQDVCNEALRVAISAQQFVELGVYLTGVCVPSGVPPIRAEAEAAEAAEANLVEELIVHPGDSYVVEDHGDLGQSNQASLVCKYLFRVQERTRVYWYSPNDLMGRPYCPERFESE